MKQFIGELTGTFILVFFGCGSVAVSVLYGSFQGLFQIAALWGLAVTLAIYVSRGLSCAHLNPAVSVAFAAAGRMSARKLPAYLAAQFLGAFLAAALLYALYGGDIAHFEASHQLVRGSANSYASARMFGEYFFRPEGGGAAVTLGKAFLAEGAGTFFLLLFIFALTDGCNVGRPHEQLAPVFIGAAITALICLFAPLTQAGFNPARDFGPRAFSYLAGWGKAAIPGPDNGSFLVYILAPLAGGISASLLFRYCLQPLMESGGIKNTDCCD